MCLGALILAAAAGLGIHQIVHWLVAKQATPEKPLSAEEVIRTSLAILTLTGAVLAGVYAYRKQRIAESDAHRADDSQLAERYTTASEQLGHTTPAVRLAGVYAMARLADDWTEQRQVCVDVLCAYLRMPYEPDRTSDQHKEGEREVRQTIIRVIGDHLRGHPVGATPSWSDCSFDFTRATFDGVDFSQCLFHNTVSFSDAIFCGDASMFSKAVFSGDMVSFHGAEFNDGNVFFDGAEFRGGRVYFTLVKFTGALVLFVGAKFSGGLTGVHFDSTTFGGGAVNFDGAVFGSAEGTFRVADFCGSKVSFKGTEFRSGGVTFKYAKFRSGVVTFDSAEFVGATVAFGNTEFSGSTVSFNEAKFRSGKITFGVHPDLTLEDEYIAGAQPLKSAVFSGGSVTFDGAECRGAEMDWGPFSRPPGCGG
ncbi:pentapeptide repeat-containing protein [Streptomyces sp. NBC_01262]|uniref:pentapeptide repeat-containing protein n=1 Tax=Streptomyces sp. NBC_01262 TaxID=2903803 RepID=UPI002E30B417|nr:pentapeptide repeat-containing protein [Streptomyces sp. NBC_01262]